MVSALDAGVQYILVDWENQGKKARQRGFDTQVNHDTYEDLCRIRNIVPRGRLLCRINGFRGEETFHEIERAIDGGADEIFVPMVVSPDHIESIMHRFGKDVDISMLIETNEAIGYLVEFAQMPLKRVYVGLNDLHISCNTPNIFYPLVDDTITRIRNAFDVPVGVGGLTHPGGGEPVSSRYLINEYARQQVDFSFLRRTFIKDCKQHSMASMVAMIQQAFTDAGKRTPAEEQVDYLVFKEQVESWITNPLYL